MKCYAQFTAGFIGRIILNNQLTTAIDVTFTILVKYFLILFFCMKLLLNFIWVGHFSSARSFSLVYAARSKCGMLCNWPAVWKKVGQHWSRWWKLYLGDNYSWMASDRRKVLMANPRKSRSRNPNVFTLQHRLWFFSSWKQLPAIIVGRQQNLKNFQLMWNSWHVYTKQNTKELLSGCQLLALFFVLWPVNQSKSSFQQ